MWYYLCRKSKLNGHIASVHEGKKPFKYNICDVSFTQKGEINGHFASVHEGKKAFQGQHMYVMQALQERETWI